MGTPATAVPSLRRLHASGHRIVAVVTRPDRPRGRGRVVSPSEVARAAGEMGLPLFRFPSVNSEECLDELRCREPDLIVVVAFGQIFRQPLLELPRAGCVNLHFSLLPKYRGAAPVERAIEAGEAVTGVTTMFMTAELDAGDIILSRQQPIDLADTAGTLAARLAELGAELLDQTVLLIARGEAPRSPQDASMAALAPPIRAEEAVLDWSQPAQVLCQRVRAFNPRPGAVTLFRGRSVKVWEMEIAPEEEEGGSENPGEVVDVSRRGIMLQAGQGVVLLREVQPENRRRMSGVEFANGFRVVRGDIFGS